MKFRVPFREKNPEYIASHDLSALTYGNRKSVQMHLVLHGRLPIQKMPQLYYHKCLATIRATIIIVPLTITATATVFPSVNELSSEKAFYFNGSWENHSPSWVSSQLYHINCSYNKKESAYTFGISFNDTFKSCERNVANIETYICLSCFTLSLNSNFKLFVLSLYFSSVDLSAFKFNFGTIHVFSVWKSFCGNQKYVNFLYEVGGIFKGWFLNQTLPMQCAKLITSYNLHTNFFRKNKTYDIEVQVADFQYAKLQFLEHFLKLADRHNIMLFYRWQRQGLKRDNVILKANYKLLFSKKSSIVVD